MVHNGDRPGGGAEWTCPFCRHQVVSWPNWHKVMVSDGADALHVRGAEQVPGHLQDSVLELTEADQHWLRLANIVWSGGDRAAPSFQ
jgi:hypothetical protein